MKIDKIVTHTETAEAEFKGLTLLSVNEYKKFSDNIPTINDWWWLRSPGGCQSDAACVDYDGSLLSYYVNYVGACVRPALILNTSMEIGGKFKFYHHTWTVISKEYALCDESFCQMAFRENWKADNANNYEASDVKRYLDCEWEKMQNGN